MRPSAFLTLAAVPAAILMAYVTVSPSARPALAASPAHVCSKVSLVDYRFADYVYFIGRALADTILAGRGPVRYTTGTGHSGHGRSRSIYGQLVHVDQVGEQWKSALPEHTRDVVLVPWDYAADCSPIVWGLSAQWIAPGTEGVYHGQLRDPSDWVDNHPTFDVHTPRSVPYPVAELVQRSVEWERGDDPAPPTLLTLEEALHVFGLLPTFDSLWAAPLMALKPLNQWAAVNPTLSERWPASELLRGLRRQAEDIGVLSRRVELAGTYRVVVENDGGDSVVFYSRTVEWPTSTMRTIRRDESFEPGNPIIGYYFASRWAPSLRELPDSTTSPLGDYYAVSITSVEDTPDSTVWRGDAPVVSPADSLRGHGRCCGPSQC